MGRQERRGSTRVQFNTTASLSFAKDDYPNCETGDLSVKGVFVRGVSGRTIGDRCTVVLHLSGSSSDLVLRMQGEVTRSQDNGVGIKFSEIDLDSFSHLKNIIYYNSDHAEELGADQASALQAPESVDDFE